MFGGLFAESSKPTFKAEPIRAEPIYMDTKYDDDALDLAKSIHFTKSKVAVNRTFFPA